MAANRTDYSSVARDIVSLALDRIADRVTTSEKLPDAVKSLGSRWHKMSGEERNQVASTVADGLQTALAAVPVLIAAAAAKYRSDENDSDDESSDDEKKDKKRRKKKNKKR